MINLLKKIVYFFIGRYVRTRIFWRFQTCKFIWKNKLLSIRSESELTMANTFRAYWEKLSIMEQSEVRARLIKDLNSESVGVVDQFIKRHLYIASHNLLEQSVLFTELEIKEQKECSSDIQRLTKEMKAYHFSFLPSECFYGLSGLRWLPKDIIERLKGGIFVDAGAYEGDTAVFFKEKFKLKHLYAFEPDNKNYKILEYNCKLAGKEHFTLIQAGLSNQSGTARLSSKGGESRLSTDKNDQVMNLLKLDDYWQENVASSQKISLIKMDIEGAEISALQGMKNIIREQKPVLAISIYHGPEDFFTIKPWLETICPQYRYIIKKASPFALTGETMLLAYID